MRKEGIEKKLDRVIERIDKSNEKLENVIQRDKAFRAKSGFWGLIGGAIGGGIVWLFKFIIYKIFL